MINKDLEQFCYDKAYVHLIKTDILISEDILRNMFPCKKVDVYLIDSNQCLNRIDLFINMKRIFKLPDYFASNFDSLEECLADLEWLNNEGCILTFYDSPQILSKESIESLLIFIRLLERIGKDWSKVRTDGLPHTKQPKIFHTILICSDNNYEDFNRQLNFSGITIPAYTI